MNSETLYQRAKAELEYREQAREELERRTLACSHLLHFTTYTYPQYVAELAHQLIAETLTEVVHGTVKRLMLFCPPQHGKSELASVRLPAFWLGKRPSDPVILTSYAASLAHRKSRQSRDVVEGASYRALFPDTRTNPTSRAVNDWSLLNRRGGMVAAGVGGPITGHGALLGIIDDPFENWAQAQSETIRDNVWQWYRSTFRTRIWQDGAIVLIMTRWHEDDLAGRLLKAQPGEWHVLRLPALAETQEARDAANAKMGRRAGLPDPLGRAPEEALCPLRFSRETLLETKRDVGSYVWGAQYQGTPSPPAGNRFKREWFAIRRAAPAQFETVVRYWDKAATAGGGAHTAGVLIMRVGDGTYGVLDVVRGQWSTGARRKVMRQTAQLDRQRYGDVAQWIEQEPGSSGVDSVRDEIRMLAGFPVFAERPTGSKEVRATPLEAQCEAGNVWLLEGSWNQAYIEELAAFPNGATKDQVDASSGGFNKIVARAKPKAMVVNL